MVYGCFWKIKIIFFLYYFLKIILLKKKLKSSKVTSDSQWTKFYFVCVCFFFFNLVVISLLPWNINVWLVGFWQYYFSSCCARKNYLRNCKTILNNVNTKMAIVHLKFLFDFIWKKKLWLLQNASCDLAISDRVK